MYNCYNEAVRYVNSCKEENHDTKLIRCLISQYQYGIDAQKELYYKLQSMGII